MPKLKSNHGNVFSVPLPDGTFIFGKVLLDIYPITKKQLFPMDSPLAGLGKALLVEMYERVSPTQNYEPSDILIPGAFVDPDNLGSTWPIVAHEDIDVESIQFPEALIGHMHEFGEVNFRCGEISLPLPMLQSEIREIGVWQTRHSSFLWHYTCLHELGRQQEIPAYCAPTCHLRDSDLRYSPYRDEIYQHLPISQGDSYFVQQKSLGLNFERLYE